MRPTPDRIGAEADEGLEVLLEVLVQFGAESASGTRRLEHVLTIEGNEERLHYGGDRDALVVASVILGALVPSDAGHDDETLVENGAETGSAFDLLWHERDRVPEHCVELLRRYAESVEDLICRALAVPEVYGAAVFIVTVGDLLPLLLRANIWNVLLQCLLLPLDDVLEALYVDIEGGARGLVLIYI